MVRNCLLGTVWGCVNEIGFQNKEFDESLDLYYVDKGSVSLYNNTCRITAYVNLQVCNTKTVTFGEYTDHVDKLFRPSNIRNWTGRSQFGPCQTVFSKFRGPKA
jgi:hypothetical protein